MLQGFRVWGFKVRKRESFMDCVDSLLQQVDCRGVDVSR